VANAIRQLAERTKEEARKIEQVVCRACWFRR